MKKKPPWPLPGDKSLTTHFARFETSYQKLFFLPVAWSSLNMGGIIFLNGSLERNRAPFEWLPGLFACGQLFGSISGMGVEHFALLQRTTKTSRHRQTVRGIPVRSWKGGHLAKLTWNWPNWQERETKKKMIKSKPHLLLLFFLATLIKPLAFVFWPESN